MSSNDTGCLLVQLLLENEILKAAILDLRLGNSTAAKALVTNSHAKKSRLSGPDIHKDEVLAHVPICLEHMSG